MKLGNLGSMRPSIGGIRWRRLLARFDWTLFFTLVALVAIGLANLYSATLRTQHSSKFDQQLIWTAIGAGMFALFAAIDYRNLHRLAWLGLGAVILAILAVKFLSDPIKGSQRWLTLGSFNVQPSEFAKIAVIVALARLMHDRAAGELSDPAQYAPLIAFLLVPIGLVAWQPDLGTSILIALIVCSVTAGLASSLWPLGGGILAALSAAVLLRDRLYGYQIDRLQAFMNPEADPTGAGWHTQQSILAVGSGRTTGKGFLDATQNHFDFLPEHWTDFPFSVWAEEWGFIGSIFLLGLFVFLILWCVNIGLSARDRFGTAICLGVAALIFWQVIVNTAMVLGLAPVVGVTLPFISYGGSSTIACFIGLGLVASVSLRREGL